MRSGNWSKMRVVTASSSLKPKKSDKDSGESDAKMEKNGSTVVAMSWNPAGSLLAVACFDGRALVWSNSGELKRTLKHHKVRSVRLRQLGLALDRLAHRCCVPGTAVGAQVEQQGRPSADGVARPHHGRVGGVIGQAQAEERVPQR